MMHSPAQLKAAQAAVKAAQAERSLFRFLRDYAWPVLQPATPFVDNWHIHAICDHLEALSRGEIKFLVINMPFRMLKSTIVSQAFPAWEWIASPHIQYLTASYAKDVATRDAVDTRRIIESPEYSRAWSDRFIMTSDQNVKQRYENNRRGSRVVTATDAAGTGFGGNRIIIDDPVSALEADSPAKRKQSIEWFKGTASTRMNNPKDDALVAVHQRLNLEDLTGYILETESDVVHLVLPMRYDKKISKPIKYGTKDPRTRKGQLLFPARLDEKTVKTMEVRLGKYHTAAQLQQAPQSREGSIFKLNDWRYYHVPPAQMLQSMDEVIWSWDCAFKDSTDSDFVAGMCIGRRGADKYLLARVCEQLSFSSTKAQVENRYNQHPFKSKTIAVLVEDKANGPAVIDSLKSTIPALIAVTPQGGKVARANATQPQHEAGNFYLPSPTMKGYEWVNDLTDLFSKFPAVDNDDDVDAWTQGVIWFMTREGYTPPSAAPSSGGSRTFS